MPIYIYITNASIQQENEFQEIIQRHHQNLWFHNDLGRSVGETNAIQLVWLNRFTGRLVRGYCKTICSPNLPSLTWHFEAWPYTMIRLICNRVSKRDLKRFWPFGAWHLQICITLYLDKITDEDSVPEMRIWSILLIQSDLKMSYLFL